MTASDVVVVGGGPSGLSVAIELRRLGVGSVTVIDREEQAGGVPRDTHHTGFGMRDLHRLLSGPAYASALVRRAGDAGVVVRTSTTVTGWLGPLSLQLADPEGISQIDARAVVLATGVRERPRAARLVPGDRGSGIFTTGSLQRLTGRYDQSPGTRAVVVGAEHVSFSAILTLAHAGCRTVAVVTTLAHHQTYWPLRVGAATRHRVPIIRNAAIAEIHGRHRVEGVTLTNGRDLDCDTIVFTGDWIPDDELARRGDIDRDPAHLGPLVDTSGRTNRDGVFAIGNLVHPAETADICAIGARHAAPGVMEWLAVGDWPSEGRRLLVEPPITWISPAIVRPGRAVARDRFVLRVDEIVDTRSIEISQGDTVLWHGNVVGRKLIPNRSISIASDWIDAVDVGGTDLVVRIRD